MNFTDKERKKAENNRDITDIWPFDTIHMVIPNSCVSPSDTFARQIELADKLTPLHPIKDHDDASRFDIELDLFVYKIRKSAIGPVESKYFPKPVQEMTASEEREEQELYTEFFLTKAVYQYALFDGLPLGDVYDQCLGNYRIFSILLDLKINFANLSAYVYELLGAEYLVINSPQALEPRMELQFYANACVMTCRAIWDKLLGVIVLVELGIDAYGNFISSSSRKKYIRKHIEKLQSDTAKKENLEEFLMVIEKLDNTFRTQEAHGSGGNVRNAAFSDGSLSSTILLEIIGHYNYLHEYLDNHWHDVSFLNEKINFINSCNGIEKED